MMVVDGSKLKIILFFY